jgi:uncharacterized protein (TIGR02145 family)
MKIVKLVFLLLILVNKISAQGVTKYGESTSTSTNFVNKNGQTGSTSVLNKNGQVLTLPTLTTTAASSITNNSATSGGNITSNGGATITARGVCWSTSANPTITNSKTTDGTGTGTFASSLTSLSTVTNYHVRAYATNSVGTAYGNDISFTTVYPNCGTVSDVDGHTYNTVTIGSQCWMQENLKTKKYRSGAAISYVSSASTWNSETTGAYCYYATYDTAKYGLLYNWYAVTSIDSLAPVGWHVATNADYTALITALSGSSTAGGALKETGVLDWTTPNTGATNSSGFTALPGGYRNNTGTGSGGFTDIQTDGNFWTTTSASSTTADALYLYYGSAAATQSSYLKTLGFSVRCVKN